MTGIKATVPAYSRDGRITERALKAAADVMEVAGILKKQPDARGRRDKRFPAEVKETRVFVRRSR